jgi:TIR domain
MTGAGGAADRDAPPEWRWDVALSFAGAQRGYVEQVAQALKARGIRCFYDADEEIDLWGKFLPEELPAIYGEQAAAVVMFVSAEYANRDWTRLERRAALSRAVRERREYVLPARFDDSVLPGLLPDMVTVDLRGRPAQQFADMIADKLAKLGITGPAPATRPAPGPAAGAGRLLAEVTDPFALEVHRPVQPEDVPPGLPVLPDYVPREHDRLLGHVVAAAAAARSGIAVLVGGSSTGKTRACWEALGLLRDQDQPWRLWHPIDPSRPDAALRELPDIGPRTVVWLNEAQFYLDTADAGLGERVAAGLRELLRDPGRSPVLVLATLWPEFWDTLTVRPASGSGDPHAQARELLAGHDIAVPAAFTPAQVSQLAATADPRLALAAGSAQNGEVIQFLAGAPELLARYRNAPTVAQAMISAAMDARRLGMGAGLPQAFLTDATSGYLTDDQWDGLGEDWAEQALAYAAVPCQGARGPLTVIRPRPGRAGRRNPPGQPAGPTATADGPLYRLADYLDQYGRAHRASQIPPPGF